MVSVQRLARSQWLVVLLPYSAIAGGGGGGGGKEWMPEVYERSYVEAAITITFLALALAFEKVWHHLYNHVKKSHQSQEAAPEDLFLDLMNRAGDEFMTLGFLAFCIFTFNTVGGFKLCVNTIHDEGVSLPVSEGEWLHLAEVVHMQLFLGMIIYFAVISRTVHGGVAKLRLWDNLQSRCRGMVGRRELPMLPTDKDLQEYSQWLYYFNYRMLLRAHQNPLEFADLFTELDIDWAAEDCMDRLRTLLVDDFSFYRYLALNVSAGIRDSIQIHTKTWFVMIVLFALFGLLHRFAHWSMYNLMPAFVVAAILILLVMHIFVRRKQANLLRRTRPRNEEAVDLNMEVVRALNSVKSECPKKRPLNERFNTEVIVIRVLQVMLFLMSYILARVVINVEDWHSDPIQSLIFALVLSAILLLVTHWLPKSVPLFLAIMSMPPYVDDDNFRLFVDVLVKCAKEHEMLAMVLSSSHRKGSKASAGLGCQNESEIRRMVLSSNSRLNSKARSDVGATMSERGTGVDCQKDIEMRLMVCSSSPRKDSKARSDMGPIVSEGGTSVGCQNSTPICNTADESRSEEGRDNEWNDLVCTLADGDEGRPPESESPCLALRMASVV